MLPTVVRRESSLSPPPAKRQRIDLLQSGYSDIARELQATPSSDVTVLRLTSTLNYRDGVMLAPMVRSGTCEYISRLPEYIC
jgi:hypothetical protein